MNSQHIDKYLELSKILYARQCDTVIKLSKLYNFDPIPFLKVLKNMVKINKMDKTVKPKTAGNQSQKHGFIVENSIRELVFNLPKKVNDTKTHDIPKEENIFDSNENCSIKTTGSNTICCGDILRFYKYNFDEKNTIIVAVYTQSDDQIKTIVQIYEINYNKECHKKLFGNLPEEAIQEYVDNVKSIPRKTKGQDAINIFDYKNEKKKLENLYPNKITINPKVDSNQSRVQCSIPNFEETLKEFITYKSPSDVPNLVRNKKIPLLIESKQRNRKPRNLNQ